MKKIERKDIWLFLAQAGVWIFVLSLPTLIAFLSTQKGEAIIPTAIMSLCMLQSPMLVYFANFYLLQRLFFRRYYVLFVLANLLLMVLLNFGLFYINRNIPEMPEMAWIGFYTNLFVYFLLNCAMVAAALALRHFIRTSRMEQQLKEERGRRMEAELSWLKNQINPHFLFNTLNNISSLTQIDPDKAQDTIAQLSDLLRYAIYETDKPLVPVKGEVEFMRNYIELMKLRYNARTLVNYQFSIDSEEMKMAPLLFISLVENAFKHGTSSSQPSQIDLSLFQDGERLIFVSENTNYAKSDTDRSGSGVGLENTRRRLELMYPGRYVWEQRLDEGIYHLKIIITQPSNVES